MSIHWLRACRSFVLGVLGTRCLAAGDSSMSHSFFDSIHLNASDRSHSIPLILAFVCIVASNAVVDVVVAFRNKCIIFIVLCMAFHNAGQFASTHMCAFSWSLHCRSNLRWPLSLRNYDLHFKSHWNDTVFFLALFQLELNESRHWITKLYSLPQYPIQYFQLVGILLGSWTDITYTQTLGHWHAHTQIHCTWCSTYSEASIWCVGHRYTYIHMLYILHNSGISSQCAIKFNWHGMRSRHPSNSENSYALVPQCNAWSVQSSLSLSLSAFTVRVVPTISRQ